MDSTKFTCRCGQEDWYHESRANTNEGPDAMGRIHRIYEPCDPLVPMPGRPHLRRMGGKWQVIVHRQTPPWSLSAMALAHAEVLNQDAITGVTSYHLGREMFMFVDDKGPQEITFSERQDPTQW